jgi:hypothetical protein
VLIDTTFLIDNPVIIQGLIDGSLKRYGGIIRETGTGQIVRHLVEPPGLTEALSKLPFPPTLDGTPFVPNLVGHGITISKLNNIQTTLSSVLGLTQIAAGASVLNLGVSLAGFIYMGFKLNQIQASLDTLHKLVEAGFDRIENRLNQMSNQLVYLCLLVEYNTQEQKRLGNAIAELHQTIILKEIAALQAELLNRNRFPESPVQDTIKVASKVRMILSNQAMQTLPEFDAETILKADIAVQGWAVATAVEANLLLETGLINDAEQLLTLEVPRFKQVAIQWADKLLVDERPQFSTAYRFGASRFHPHISRERVERIAQISSVDCGLSANKIQERQQEAEVEFEMFHASQLDKKWTYQQMAIAEYLDTLSELSARLESLQAFSSLCQRWDVKNIRDILPDENAKPSFYLLNPQ